MKQHILLRAICIGALFLSAFLFGDKAESESPTIVITEIGAFEPNNGYEWIEVMNVSDMPIDMEGWQFWDAEYNRNLILKQGEHWVLEPGAYAVIAQDDELFLEKYPSTSAAIIMDSFWAGLTLNGKEIGLKNADGEFMEQFTYIPAHGTSLERIDPRLLDYTAHNWRAHPTSQSVGEQNFWYFDSTADAPPLPFIDGPSEGETQTPLTFDGGRSYGSGALLYLWYVNATEASSTPFLTYVFPLSGDHEVSLRVEDVRGIAATTTHAITILAPQTPSTTPSSTPPIATTTTSPLGRIVINEVMTNPNSGETEWVELYNMSTTSVSLDGLTLREGGGSIAIPGGSVMVAYDFFVVAISGNRLNNAGDIVELLFEEDIIDSIVYGNWGGATVAAPTQGTTIARIPDGIGTFQRTTVPTKGTTNILQAPPAPSSGSSGSGSSVSSGQIVNTQSVFIRDVVINEFVSDPKTDEKEWIELYNTTNQSLTLDGWYITDGSNAKTTLTGMIAPKGFFVVEAPKGNLNNTGDTIALIAANNLELDRITYGNWQSAGETASVPGRGQSLARVSDGEDSDRDRIDFVVTSLPTPGAPNQIVAGVMIADDAVGGSSAIGDATGNIRITELLPNPSEDDATDEYIELYNAGDETIILDGWQLGDATSARHTITDLTLAPGAYATLYRTTTKVALNNTGTEVVSLYNPVGDIVDTVTYTGPARDDMAYAKFGEVWEWTTTLTPGAPNGGHLAGTMTSGELVVYIDTPVVVGVPTSFDASDSVFALSASTTIVWLFPDGSEQTGVQVLHTFLDMGMKTVVVRVFVDSQLMQEEQLSVVVQAHDSNVAQPSLLAQVRISEFLPNPEGDDATEYIELYNPTTAALSLAGLLLDDIEGGSRPYTIPENTVIAAQSYLLFPRLETKISLNNTGDEVRLLFSNGTPIDVVSYSTAREGLSYTHLPDGNWVWTPDLTPGYAATSVVTAESSSATTRSRSTRSAPTITHTTIEDLGSFSAGDLVQVTGVVASLPGVLGTQFFYLVDTSGVQVYLYSKDFPDLRVGDRIQVSGEISFTGRERRIKLGTQEDIVIIDHVGAPTAKTLEIGAMSDTYIGWLIGVDAEITEVKSTYLYIDDGTAELKVYIKKGANIPTRTYSVGELVRVIGILAPSTEGLQLLPRSVDDIATTGMATYYALDTFEHNQTQTPSPQSIEQTIRSIVIGIGAIIVGLLIKVHGGSLQVIAARVWKRVGRK